MISNAYSLIFVLVFAVAGSCRNTTSKEEASSARLLFREYRSLGRTARGAFFELLQPVGLTSGKYQTYKYEYSFGSFGHSGAMYEKDRKIYVNLDYANHSDFSEANSRLFFDFSMHKGDTISSDSVALVSRYSLILEDVIYDEYTKEAVFKFRMHFGGMEPDIVHLASLEKGIIAMYSCYHHTRRESGDLVCYDFDDVVFFVGYGYYNKLNSNVSRYY